MAVNVCLEITKIFDQCMIQDCQTFSLNVDGISASDWVPVEAEIRSNSQTCGGVISFLGGPNFRTVNWVAGGSARVILRHMTTSEERLYQIPYSYSGKALLWAPDPYRMFVRCEQVARVLDVTVAATDTGLSITISVGIALVVKTAADLQFEFTEPPMCTLPPVCTLPPDVCTQFYATQAALEDFTIPPKP